MDDPTRPEFNILDLEGLEYHWWISDVETSFVVKEYSATLVDPKDPTYKGPSDKLKANALMFLRRYIDPRLRWKYLQLKTLKELWDALKGHFGNIHDTLLPELTVQWNEIRLLDYKKDNDFKKDILRLKSRLNFCGKDITKDDMIQKTLSTFPTSALILENQYRLEYDNKRITTFNKLINLLQVAKRRNEVLLNNNARPVGPKRISEANYGKMNSGKNPNTKGAGRSNPYLRGNNAQHGKGRGGRGTGRGGSSKVWRRNSTIGSNGHKMQNAPKNPLVKKKRVGDEPCYRCGVAGHWYKNCHASAKVAASYKKYRESKEQESHFINKKDNDADVNFTIADFSGKNDFAQSMDASDFD